LDADEDHLAAAAHRFAELPASDGLPLSGAIAAHRLHLDLAEARAAEARGEVADAERIRERVRRRLAEPAVGYEWHAARRVCLAVIDHGSATLVVRDGGASCMIGETALDLGRRSAARALLVILARHRLDHPGR